MVKSCDIDTHVHTFLFFNFAIYITTFTDDADIFTMNCYAVMMEVLISFPRKQHFCIRFFAKL